MAFAAPLLMAAAGAVGSALISKVLAPKPKAPTMTLPKQAQVRPNSTVADALTARRGSRDNQRTGPRGTEASGGLKTRLGQ